MTSRLREEIRQTKPFGSLGEEVHLGIARTAAVLDHAVAEELKPFGITPTQYNVLRILRGADCDGLCRGEVRNRMVSLVPDATRLLDRMEAAGLIQRARDGADRRFVTTRITPEGLRIVNELDEPMQALHCRHFSGFETEELERLSELLDRVRERL
jgi:DNA-binding MarR family transcriptional regulator